MQRALDRPRRTTLPLCGTRFHCVADYTSVRRREGLTADIAHDLGELGQRGLGQLGVLADRAVLQARGRSRRPARARARAARSSGIPPMRSARSATTHSSASTVRRWRSARRVCSAACQAKLACSSRPREIATPPRIDGVASARSRASASAARYSAISTPELPGSLDRQERRQAAQRRRHQVRDARAAEARERQHREPQALERERAGGGVEAAVVEDLVAGDERVLRAGVDLDREHVVDALDRLVQRAGDRRQAAQAERVLDAARARARRR